MRTAEALSRKALMLTDSAAHTAAWREHVTLYAKENPQALRCAFLPAGAECNRPDLSFTVDTLDQYLYVRAIAAELPTQFQLKNLIAVADAADVRLRTLAI